MGAQLFELECVHTGREVSLTTGDYSVLAEGTSFGSVVRSPMYPEVFDAQRVVVAGAPVGMREQQIRVRVASSTLAGLQSSLDALERVCDDVSRKGGGWLRHRSTSGNAVTRYRVAFAQTSGPVLGGDRVAGSHYESAFRAFVTLALVVDPYGLADPYEVFDGFSVDSFGTAGLYNLGGADWTVSSLDGAPNPTITGGALVTGATNALTAWTHTGTTHLFGDVQVTAQMSAAAYDTNGFGSVYLKYVDANNYIRVQWLSSTGTTTGVIQVRVAVGGVVNTRATESITLPAAGTAFWGAARIEGNVVHAEYWTSQPTPMGTPTVTEATPYALTTTEAAALGSTIRGQIGIASNGVSAAWSYHDFRAEPLTYRNVAFPNTLRLEGAWGGSTDALAGIYYTGSGGTAPVSMLYAWWPRVGAHNYVWNGGAEVVGTVAATAYGWSTATIASLMNVSATSVARITTAGVPRTGSACFEAVLPASSDAGVNFPIYRRGGFRKGVTYTATGYLKSTGGSTTVMRIKAGISSASDRGVGSSVALTTAYQAYTVTWTPLADADLAYVVISSGAATATTFQFDDVVVYEGTTAPTCELGGFGPGFIPAAAYNTAAASTRGTEWTNTVDADYLVGTGPQGSAAITADTGELEFAILPHLFEPDDYTSDEVDVAVFARVELASTQTSLNCVMSIAGERGTSYGARRYGSFRSSGKALTLPSAGTVFKPYYLGTITLKVDRSRPRREWLRLAFSNSGSATGTVGVDYLVVVPARCCARSQSGSSAANVPDFIASTAETTKVIGVGTSGEITGDLLGAVVEHANANSFTPDDGILGEPLRLPPDGATLLVWPSDMVVDLTDSSAATMAETYAGTVRVAVQPRTHLLKQAT